MSFADLKAKANDMSALVGAAESATQKQSYGDDRMWKPTVDKAGNGMPLFGSYLRSKVMTYLGLNSGTISFKDLLVNGM